MRRLTLGALAATWSRVQSAAILEVHGLTRSFSNGQHALTVLRDVSFTLAVGETCAVVGPSGSGKTTLLGLCAGLDLPSSGTVRLAGHDLGTLDEDGRARVRNEAVGFVFQSFQLLPTLTALENVMLPAELRGNRKARDRARELLAEVGLGDRLGHFPAQLSGGEQQRVAIARAFVNQPRILFADEPTGNLDGDTAHHVVDMLFSLNAAAGTALVLVTHDHELARRARQVIRLRAGSVVEHLGVVETSSPTGASQPRKAEF
jgi:putative ABC transport system ATP-binding protein